MITRQGADAFYIVTNAGRRDEDTAWMRQQLERWNSENGDAVELNEITDHALVALQGESWQINEADYAGPKAVEALAPLLPSDFDMPSLLFGQSANTTLDGVPVHMARGGYTGSDGVEVRSRFPASTDPADLHPDRRRRSTDREAAGRRARHSRRSRRA